MHLTRSRTSVALLAAVFVTGGAGASEPTTHKSDVSRLSTDAAQRYAAITPRPAEVKWRQIPWVVDLNKGIRLAKEEKRPLLIWTGQQSHPLERC